MIDVCLALSFVFHDCPIQLGDNPDPIQRIRKAIDPKRPPKVLTLDERPEYGICKWEGKWHDVCPVDKETRWKEYLRTRRPVGWIDGKPIGGPIE